jgi:NADH-quinone oxidoreductase subunit M
MVPLLILIFWIGLYPKPFFDLMAPAVNQLVQNLPSVATAMH